jgi:hypothetical protein
MTMQSMAQGLIPRLEKVEQFARAFGLDVNEWRVLAGYPAVEAKPAAQDVEACAYLIRDALADRSPEVRAAVDMIVREAQAAYTVQPTPAPVQPPFPYLIPRQPANSPFYQRAVEGIQAAYAKYQPLGYQMLDPFGTSPHHGWKFQSAEEADRAVLRYLERIALANDDKAEPEELKAARRKDE